MPLETCLCISSPMKCTISQCRTGTLYNQKHAVRFKRSTHPLRPSQAVINQATHSTCFQAAKTTSSPTRKLNATMLLEE
eukprot:837032-Pelagomonas_calceolata.AAC.1